MPTKSKSDTEDTGGGLFVLLKIGLNEHSVEDFIRRSIRRQTASCSEIYVY